MVLTPFNQAAIDDPDLLEKQVHPVETGCGAGRARPIPCLHRRGLCHRCVLRHGRWPDDQPGSGRLTSAVHHFRRSFYPGRCSPTQRYGPGHGRRSSRHYCHDCFGAAGDVALRPRRQSGTRAGWRSPATQPRPQSASDVATLNNPVHWVHGISMGLSGVSSTSPASAVPPRAQPISRSFGRRRRPVSCPGNRGRPQALGRSGSRHRPVAQGCVRRRNWGHLRRHGQDL